jgi:hypothetical protein
MGCLSGRQNSGHGRLYTCTRGFFAAAASAVRRNADAAPGVTRQRCQTPADLQVVLVVPAERLDQRRRLAADPAGARRITAPAASASS